MTFFDLYTERQSIKNRMRYTGRKLDPQVYQSLQDKKAELTEKMDKFIKDEKK